MKQNVLDKTLGRTLQYISWSWQLDAWNKWRIMVIAKRKTK